MRTRMRRELLPAIESIFPRAVERLLAYADDEGRGAELGALEDVLRGDGVKLRRAHRREALRAGVARLPAGWSLRAVPGGWNLTRDES
jgi:hypothetical protein